MNTHFAPLAPVKTQESFRGARLTFENIHHDYRGQPTIRGVSLSAEPGEVLCLLGPSGSGKTTLLRVAAGIEMQTSGRVVLGDNEIAGERVFLPPEKRDIGLVFQDFALFPHMNVMDNVRFGLRSLGSGEAVIRARDALETVGLWHYAGKYPHELSGGEQQRVALARALAPRPRVLLMDEPFSGLDSRLKDAVRADTLEILRKTGATAIIVTHDPEEAMRMADKIVLLRDGLIVQQGTALEIFRQPRNLFAASFFSELNTWNAIVRNGQVETPFGILRVGGMIPDGNATVAIRLSSVKVTKERESVCARVVSRRFLGSADLLFLEIQGLDRCLHARIDVRQLPPDIETVGVSVTPDDILVFEKAA